MALTETPTADQVLASVTTELDRLTEIERLMDDTDIIQMFIAGPVTTHLVGVAPTAMGRVLLAADATVFSMTADEADDLARHFQRVARAARRVSDLRAQAGV